MQYAPTLPKVSEISRRVITAALAFTFVLSIVLSTVFSSSVYAGSEQELVQELETNITETTQTDTVDKKEEVDNNLSPSTENSDETTDQIEVEKKEKQQNAEYPEITNPCDNDANTSLGDENEGCVDQKTLREIVDVTPETSTLSAALSVLDTYELCDVAAMFDQELDENITVFAPSNDAFSKLVRMPGNSSKEINELLANPDELCELISYHVHENAIKADDVPVSAVITTFAKDMMLQVQKTPNGVYVDQAKVILADIEASNGIAHLINDVLLPEEAGTINDVKTSSNSPALNGTISGIMNTTENGMDNTFCVVIRVDGVAYNANVNGMTWHIDKGVVTLDPYKTSTLFDIVVRDCAQSDTYASSVSMEHQSKGKLVGLTMVRDVVSYKKPVSTPTNNTGGSGQVLGTTTTDASHPTVYSYVTSSGCGKDVCVANNGQGGSNDNLGGDTEEQDSDGDGVVDSEDPEPNNPDVTGQDQEQTNENNEEENNSGENNENDSEAFWWFIGGGGIALLWYLLWQRGGKENL